MGLQSLIQEQRSAGNWDGVPAASGSLWNPWAPEVQLEAPSAATLAAVRWWRKCVQHLVAETGGRRQRPCEPITQSESPGEGLQLH